MSSEFKTEVQTQIITCWTASCDNDIDFLWVAHCSKNEFEFDSSRLLKQDVGFLLR